MRRKLQAILSVVCVAAVISSCAPPKEQTKQPASNNRKENVNEKQGNLDVLNPSAYGDVTGIYLERGSYISIIGKQKGSAFWDEVKAGAGQAADDLNAALGYKGEDKIKVNYSAPSKGENIEEQINILDEELARNPVAVGMAMIDATACDVQFDLAAENGIPIIAFDSGSDYKGIQAMCSTNNGEIGKTAALKLSSMIEEKGAVAIFVHDKESTTGRVRQEAFLKEIQEKHSGVTVPLIYHLDDQEEVAKTIAEEKNAVKEEGAEDILPEDITQTEVIMYLLEKNPDIKGCFAANIDSTQELLEALAEMGKEDLAIIAVDGGKEQLKALEDGRVKGLLVQNPYGMGYAAVIAAARASLSMGNQAFVDTSFIWVTQDNMDKKTIKRMLY